MIVSITELKLNSGKSQAVNLLRSKIRNVMAKIRDLLGTDLFSTNGDSADGIVGLRQLVKATGQVGKLDQSDISTWASDVDSSTTTLTEAAMQQAYLDASIGNDAPDIIVCTKAIYKSYWALLQADQRFGPAKSGDAGFQYLLFNGVPVFHDSHCPANHMFFLNSRWLYLYVHKDMNFLTERIGLTPSQAVHYDRVTLGTAFATDNRRMHSLMSDLTA